MSKYVDAGKLIAEIERYKQGAAIARFDNAGENADYFQGKVDLCDDLTHIITTLQQEQPEVQNRKFVFPKYLYARTKDNKTIDMSYAPQDMTAVEYIRNDFVEQEQPEVDLEKELDRYLRGEFQQTAGGNFNNYIQVARHFYELGLNARKGE